MSDETLLCFGGPRDGELLTVHRPNDVVLVTRPPDLSAVLASGLNGPIELPEPFRYRVERVYLHDESEHWGPRGMHGDWCMINARCLVAPGYPKHRITDAINALAAFASIAPLTPWGAIRAPQSAFGEHHP